ncbi:MAG: pyruvate kinase [Erysipelotrichaceae bacterium]|nr:pyruvate kinase [Erysipelotrichaceae bacterium]
MVDVNLRKTKIICTIGPASEDFETMKKLIKAGMNVMRLNFSHGSYEEHAAKMQRLRQANKELGTNVAILLDTKGPEIRTGDFVDGVANFKKGQICVITTEDIVGTSDRFTVTYKNLYKDVKPGGFILVNDGQLSLQVDHVENEDIYCVCVNDGKVKNKRGINVPGVILGFDFLSQKDKEDIEFGCQQEVNYIAASFTRRKQDILDIRRLLAENERPEIQVLAKIENLEGVENLDEIISVADGIMVARGDLGVEVPAEDVPMIQRQIIRKCNAAGKVVITATQMLESMQENPRPTRAEVSDVANAVFDGTDAIMLSGETAAGKYPVESVETMAKIAARTAMSLDYGHLHRRAIRSYKEHDDSESICMAVAEIAARLDVAMIIAFTESGFTAKRMSRYRPKAPIIAATPTGDVMRNVALSWGVKPVMCKQMKSMQGLINLAKVIALENGANMGDKFIITGGTPGVSGQTNYLELVTLK